MSDAELKMTPEESVRHCCEFDEEDLQDFIKEIEERVRSATLKEVEHLVTILELTEKSWGERWVKFRKELKELES